MTLDRRGNGGFIEKNEPSRIEFWLPTLQRSSFGGDVRAILLRRPQTFFKGQLQMMKKTRNRRLAYSDLFLRQSGCELCQRNVRLIRNHLPNQLLVLCKREILIATKFCRADAASFPVKFEEPDDRTYANFALFCRLRDGSAIQNCLNRPSAQVFRIRLCNPCWPPASRKLESDSRGCESLDSVFS